MSIQVRTQMSGHHGRSHDITILYQSTTEIAGSSCQYNNEDAIVD